MKIFLSELIGTFILSSSLNFMTDYSAGQKVNLLEIILGFLLAIQFSRKISGGHVNPAVTLVFYLFENDENKKFIESNIKEYIGGQLAGGLLSPILSRLLINNSLTLTIGSEANYLGAFIMEMIAASVFYLVILFQASKKQDLYSNDEVVSSVVLTFALAGGISIAGNESGAGLNPAISLSQNLVTLFVTGDVVSMKYTLIYILAPLAASYLAVFLYKLLNEDDITEVKVDLREVNHPNNSRDKAGHKNTNSQELRDINDNSNNRENLL